MIFPCMQVGGLFTMRCGGDSPCQLYGSSHSYLLPDLLLAFENDPNHVFIIILK